MTVHETYMDAGASGATLARPALQQLLADCRAGRIGVLLTRDGDRLSRDKGKLFALLHRFRKELSARPIIITCGEIAQSRIIGEPIDELAALPRARRDRNACPAVGVIVQRLHQIGIFIGHHVGAAQMIRMHIACLGRTGRAAAYFLLIDRREKCIAV